MNETLESRCYSELGHAVVKQACVDYLNYKYTIDRSKKNLNNLSRKEIMNLKKAKSGIESVLSFFYGDDFLLYCDLNPNDIIYGLNKLASNGQYYLNNVYD